MRLSNEEENEARKALVSMRDQIKTMLTADDEGFEVVDFEEDCKRLQFYVDALFGIVQNIK